MKKRICPLIFFVMTLFMITGTDIMPAYAAVPAIAAGDFHTIALKSDGTLWSWGNNWKGQLGDGTITGRYAPAQIGTTTNWSAVAAGYLYTIALKSDGTLWAWGDNSHGQLGIGSIDADAHSTPVQIGIDTNWKAVTTGGYHAIALKNDGTLWAWGNNYSGQLGNGLTTSIKTPVQIGADTNWAAVEAGFSYTIALKNDGTLWAWGDNGRGQLCDGSIIERHAPIQVGFDTTWTTMAAEERHTIAMKNDGTLWACGDNQNGQLGIGSTDHNVHSTPIQIGTDTTWTTVAAGASHSIAQKTDGTMWAWGDNWGGQLGDDTITERHAPVKIGANTSWTTVAARDSHTFALKNDGTLWAWGYNSDGQLGDGTVIERHAPVQIMKLKLHVFPWPMFLPALTVKRN